MKMKITALLLAILMLLPLAACGSDSLLDPKHPVELEFWHVYGEQADSPMEELVYEFNETVGREKGVYVRITAQSSSSRIGELLKDSQHPGTDMDMPDVFTCHLNNALELGTENLLDWNDWFTQEELSEFVPGFLSDGEADGKLFVFPMTKSTHVLMLNGSRFAAFSDATGVQYDDLATWEGLYDAAEKYYDWSGGEVFCALDYPIRAVELNAMEHGAENFYTDDGWYDFDNEAFKDSWLQFARSLVQGHVQVADLYSNTQVMTGDVLCGLGFCAAILYYNDTVSYADGTSEPMDLHVLPMPMTEGSQPLMTQAGVGIAAYKTTDQKAEAAAVFVNWLTESERNVKFAADTGYMPVRKGAFDSIDIDTYDFPEESYTALYTALRTAQESYTPVSEPNFAGYYDKVYKLYDGLRQTQKNLPSDPTDKEVEALALATWDFFCGIK